MQTWNRWQTVITVLAEMSRIFENLTTKYMTKQRGAFKLRFYFIFLAAPLSWQFQLPTLYDATLWTELNVVSVC